MKIIITAVLLILSTLVGFVVGKSLVHWSMVAASSLALAFLSATVLHDHNFGAVSGIMVIAACLTLSQIAYLVGVSMYTNGNGDGKHC